MLILIGLWGPHDSHQAPGPSSDRYTFGGFARCALDSTPSELYRRYTAKLLRCHRRAGQNPSQLGTTAANPNRTCARAPLTDSERSLVERRGLLILSLAPVEQGQVIEGGSGRGMLRPQGLLSDSERALVERLGLLVLASTPVDRRQSVQAAGEIDMLRLRHLFTDG